MATCRECADIYEDNELLHVGYCQNCGGNKYQRAETDKLKQEIRLLREVAIAADAWLHEDPDHRSVKYLGAPLAAWHMFDAGKA